MGTFSVRIFGNDLACDVRAGFRALLAEGVDTPLATSRLIAEMDDAFDDDDEAPAAWLALAETQWDAGRLQPSVRARALELIETGAALAAFERDAPEIVPARQKELARLAAKLSVRTVRPRHFRDHMAAPAPASHMSTWSWTG